MLLAKCYPRAWRERYGVEFDALMEDVGEVVSGFLEQFITEEKAREGNDIRYMAERRLGPHIEVLDAASLPQTPASPNRAVMAGLGLLAGLLAGALMFWRRRPHGPAILDAAPQPI